MCSSQQQDTTYQLHYNSLNTYIEDGLIYEVKQAGSDSILKYFSGSHQLAMRAGSMFGKPHGTVEKFHPNGSLYESATYFEGVPIDTIKRYHSNGVFMGHFLPIQAGEQSEAAYDVIERIISYYDSAGNQTLSGGTGKATLVDPLTNDYESGEVIGGLKNGVWTGTSRISALSYRDMYANGKFIRGTSKNKKGQQFSYKEVKTDAEFKGGLTSFYNFLKTNLRYPRKAQRKGIQGNIFIYFIVEKDGSLSNLRVVRGIGGGCDEEAMRVMKKSPKWTPGTQRGQVVRQAMIQDLLFKFK